MKTKVIQHVESDSMRECESERVRECESDAAVKKIAIFGYKQRLLIIDMKTKVSFGKL